MSCMGLSQVPLMGPSLMPLVGSHRVPLPSLVPVGHSVCSCGAQQGHTAGLDMLSWTCRADLMCTGQLQHLSMC